MADPWLQDNPQTKKMFTLAGFVAGARMTSEQVGVSQSEHSISIFNQSQVARDKEELIANIRRLGAEVIETDEWDDRQVM